MKLYKIPIDNTIGAQNLTVTMFGETFVLFIRWNIRNQCWYMNLSKQDGTSLVDGIKLVTNYLLLNQYSDSGSEDFPKGDLILVSDANNALDRYTLGTDWIMYLVDNSS